MSIRIYIFPPTVCEDHGDCFSIILNGCLRPVLEDGDKSRSFTPQELMDTGCNFDQCKFPKEEEEVLRPEELLKQYHEQRTAFDSKIDAQLREIENLLDIAR